MKKLFEAWQQLLLKHKDSLSELEKNLNLETSALMANDIVALKESAVSKESASMKLKRIQVDILHLKTKSQKSLKLELNDKQKLFDLFDCFDPEYKSVLLAIRHDLKDISVNIARLNQFNLRCLDTYRSYVEGVRGIFGNARIDNAQTYNAIGKKYNVDGQGRFLNRSF